MPETEAGFNNPNDLHQWGPILRVRIGFDPSYRTDTLTLPNIPQIDLLALIDTGALTNCIYASLAQRLQLPRVDRYPVIGVHGPVTTDFYAAQIYIPSMNWVVPGRFAGLPLQKSGQPYSALIGRSFLYSVTMTYDGPTGSVVVAS